MLREVGNLDKTICIGMLCSRFVFQIMLMLQPMEVHQSLGLGMFSRVYDLYVNRHP